MKGTIWRAFHHHHDLDVTPSCCFMKCISFLLVFHNLGKLGSTNLSMFCTFSKLRHCDSKILRSWHIVAIPIFRDGVWSLNLVFRTITFPRSPSIAAETSSEFSTQHFGAWQECLRESTYSAYCSRVLAWKQLSAENNTSLGWTTTHSPVRVW